MKTVLRHIVLLSTSFLGAQQLDTLQMGSGYTNGVFYQLSSGTKTPIPMENWDIAFSVGPRTATLRISRNVTLWATTRSATPQGWNDLTVADTTFHLYNSDENWLIGAFNQTANPTNPFDEGWGYYNPSTRHVVGDSLYLLKTAQGTYWKLWVDSLLWDTLYVVHYAEVGNTTTNTLRIPKRNYPNRNFVYLSLSTSTLHNYEPPKTDWDLIALPYYTYLRPQGVYYPVTGVLANLGVKGKAFTLTSSANPDTLSWQNTSLDSTANFIGYDWKRFDMSTFQWTVADTIYYILRDKAGSYWRIRFKSFSGASTGRIVLEKKLLAAPSALVGSTLPVRIFPNPTEGEIFLDMPETMTVEVQLLSPVGTVLYQTQVRQATRLLLPQLPEGVYLLRIFNEKGSTLLPLWYL
ncbi:MAG: T9SS type A sorting domain-containing protein [Bacteroidia bacterium]